MRRRQQLIQADEGAHRTIQHGLGGQNISLDLCTRPTNGPHAGDGVTEGVLADGIRHHLHEGVRQHGARTLGPEAPASVSRRLIDDGRHLILARRFDFPGERRGEIRGGLRRGQRPADESNARSAASLIEAATGVLVPDRYTWRLPVAELLEEKVGKRLDGHNEEVDPVGAAAMHACGGDFDKGQQVTQAPGEARICVVLVPLPLISA